MLFARHRLIGSFQHQSLGPSPAPLVPRPESISKGTKMPENPRLLKLKIERLRRDAQSGMEDMLNVIGQAEELARSLPPEKTCNNNTWTNLRASELLEELTVMSTVLGGTLDVDRPGVSR